MRAGLLLLALAGCATAETPVSRLELPASQWSEISFANAGPEAAVVTLHGQPVAYVPAGLTVDFTRDGGAVKAVVR